MVKLIISESGHGDSTKFLNIVSYHTCYPIFTIGEMVYIEHKGKTFLCEVKNTRKKIIQKNYTDEAEIILTVNVERVQAC